MLLLPYIILVLSTSCHADDIFPEALVFKELGLPEMVNNSDVNEYHNGTTMFAGDLNDALMTMNFHREKINDYLCRQYVAGEILQDITSGISSESRSLPSDSHVMNISKTSTMQTDQGSSAYNAWLTKTKLMKKIYDEYDLNVKMYEKPVGFTLKIKNNESLGAYDHDTVNKTLNTTNDLKKLHPNEDSFTSPSETVSVDFEQSQSTNYDIKNSNEYKNPPDLPMYYGSSDFSSTQLLQQPSLSHGPPKSYGPPQSVYESPPPPLLYQTPPSPYAPPPLSYGPPHSSHKPPHSPYRPPQSPNKPPPSPHRPSPSSYGPPPLSYGPPPPSYSYPHTIFPSNPRPGLVPPTTDQASDITIQDIEQLYQSDDEIRFKPNRETITQGLSTVDMYDLTLTAIAFLGFGTFVMNLVMDVMSVQTGATLTMNSSPFTVYRAKRHANPVVMEINELSWTAVSMMDNMMENVDGINVNCEEVKQLCQRSKKLIKNGTNFSSKLLPIWNVSLGWLSKKLGKDTGQPVISALLGHCTLPSRCGSKS